jgi:hypothetical protein
MRSLWWLAVALAACGDVEKVPDAAVPDTYAPDTKNELTCTGGETACMGSCSNMMTDEQNCGACGTQCAPGHECVSGTCKPATECKHFKANDPTAMSGIYTHGYTGAKLYCDMTGNVEYSNLQMVLQGTVPTNFVQVRATDLPGTSAGAKAFIELYNAGNGVAVPAQFSIGVCCMKIAASVYLNMDGQYILTQPCTTPITVGPWRLTESSTPWPAPLPADFFTTNVVTEGANAGCSESTSPMLIWQKKSF